MISFVVAMSKNYVIGRNNQLPWHIPEDLKWFRRITTGKNVVMGRRTYESIGKPLPNRTNIILTRQPDYQAHGCHVFHSTEEILAYSCKGHGELCVIGGAELFRSLFPYCDRIYLTWVDHVIEGDTFFPSYDHREWMWNMGKRGKTNEKNPYSYYFLTFQRISSPRGRIR